MAKADTGAAGLMIAWQFLRNNPDLQRIRKEIEGTQPPPDFVVACPDHKDLVLAMKITDDQDEMIRLLEQYDSEGVDECPECRLALALLTDDPTYLVD